MVRLFAVEFGGVVSDADDPLGEKRVFDTRVAPGSNAKGARLVVGRHRVLAFSWRGVGHGEIKAVSVDLGEDPYTGRTPESLAEASDVLSQGAQPEIPCSLPFPD